MLVFLTKQLYKVGFYLQHKVLSSFLCILQYFTMFHHKLAVFSSISPCFITNLQYFPVFHHVSSQTCGIFQYFTRFHHKLAVFSSISRGFITNLRYFPVFHHVSSQTCSIFQYFTTFHHKLAVFSSISPRFITNLQYFPVIRQVSSQTCSIFQYFTMFHHKLAVFSSTLGFIIYFLYGVHHSSENKPMSRIQPVISYAGGDTDTTRLSETIHAQQPVEGAALGGSGMAGTDGDNPAYTASQ